MMPTLAWLCLVFFTIVGLIGTIIPGLPGTALIFLGALVHKLILPDILSWWTVGAAAVSIAASWGIDFGGSLAGAKWGGASSAGLWGAVIGGFVGLFFGLPGLILGPILGAFLGELFTSRRTTGEAAKAGLGAGFGIAISTVLRFLLGLFVTTWIIIDCLVR